MGINIVYISNILFEPYLYPCMTGAFSESEIQLNFVAYEEFGEKRDVLTGADIAVVFLNFDAMYPDAVNDLFSGQSDADDLERNAMERCKRLHSEIETYTNAKIIWFGFEDYYTYGYILYGKVPVLNGAVDRINQELQEIIGCDSFIDLKRIIAGVGISRAYSDKGKYRWNALYSEELTGYICKEIYKQYLIHKGITKKCLVLDCDGVLWGGILSEDGIEGIYLGSSGFGRRFQDFQRFLLDLYYHGVILAVCSKNDEADVLRVFREHSGMILKEQHIACLKSNWKNKPDNIKMIAQELNIGIDSIVFVDDSLFEIEAVKAILPEIVTIQIKNNMTYDAFSCFNLRSENSIIDIEQRNNTYRTNCLRESMRAQYDDYADYLRALNIRIDIHKILPDEYRRISELTQRANKCTNGKRYTLDEVKERADNADVSFYSVSVSDCFSDLGIVGAVEVEFQTLTLFCLSCRAMGREIEKEMLKYIVQNHCINNISFKPTGKNDSLLKLIEKSV